MSEDATLGGYQRIHGRPPAFGGRDGRAYSVSPLVDDVPDREGRYGAALLFVRWAVSGERPDGHLETDYLAYGATTEAALAPVLALTLVEVQRELDRCIATTSGEG
ncbi:MAG: hypothetical protein ACREMF_04760 [Gemmatimonadales bacterium]